MPRLEVRCSDDDLTRWRDKAEQAGLSLSELVRSSLEKSRLPDRQRQADLAGLVREIAKIGNNLNQIARFSNTYKTSAEAVQIVSHLVAIESEIEHVYKSLSAR